MKNEMLNLRFGGRSKESAIVRQVQQIVKLPSDFLGNTQNEKEKDLQMWSETQSRWRDLVAGDNVEAEIGEVEGTTEIEQRSSCLNS